MLEHLLRRVQRIPHPVETVFEFFSHAENLDYLTPPWLHFHILTPLPIVMREGALIDYRIRWRWVPVRWRTEIKCWNPPHVFVDQQIRGPYALWHHTHRFTAIAGGTEMVDEVRYALPFGPLGHMMHALIVRHDLERIFDYRFRQIETRLGVPEPRAQTV